MTNSFSFLVLSYNHQDYIIEHLESIKILVERYGRDVQVDLIISDDSSTDNSTNYIESWINLNSKLFKNVKLIFNEKNIGTCSSVKKMLLEVETRDFKLTAGDDVYSFENIFSVMDDYADASIISGRVIHYDSKYLIFKRIDNMLMDATQVIYKKSKKIERFKRLSYINAPNIFYRKECITHENVLSVLDKYKVVEDWPIQIQISRIFSDSEFELVDKVFVYYRRTEGSTYIVANKDFVEDKSNIYDELINMDSSIFSKVRLRIRRYCFLSNNRIINKCLNLDFYFFIFSTLLNFLEIYKRNSNLTVDMVKHSDHLFLVKKKSKYFLMNNCKD
jgi:hypothetical protein